MTLSESIQGFMVPIGARQTSAGNGCGWNLGCQQREGLHLIARRYPWELADGLQCPSMPPAPGLCATRQALIRNRVRSAASTRSRHALRWFGSRTILRDLLKDLHTQMEWNFGIGPTGHRSTSEIQKQVPTISQPSTLFGSSKRGTAGP